MVLRLDSDVSDVFCLFLLGDGIGAGLVMDPYMIWNAVFIGGIAG